MATLFEINEELKDIVNEAFEAAEENDGEIPEAIVEALEGLEMDKERKLENYVLLYKEKRAFAEAIKKEEAELAKRRKSLENSANWLKQQLCFELQGAEETVKGELFETSKVKISWRKGQQYLDGDSIKLEDLPEEFVRVIPEERSPMKKELLAFVKANGNQDFAKLAEVKYSITIK